MPEEIAVAESQQTQAPPQTETPTEEKRGADSSRINLGDLSHEAYEKYMKTGKLPPEIEERPKALTPDDRDPALKLSREEREEWLKSGNFPDRLAEETPAEKTPPAKSETKEPEFIRLGEAITPEAHAAAVKSYGERMDKAWKQAGDHPQIMKEAAVVFPKLCGGNKEAANNLLAFLDNVSAHMAHPADAMREFIRNAEFRGQIEKSTPDQVIAIMQKFDKEFQPKRTVSRAPAPATSISGKATAPVDAENAALSKGDVAGYFEAANQADIARSKRRR